MVGVRDWVSHVLVDYITVSGFASPHASTNHKLYVNGTVIKNGSGNIIRLQGFNAHVKDIDEEGMQWMKNKGFNSIRIGFYWFSIEPTERRI